jgi:hypothetical protein
MSSVPTKGKSTLRFHLPHHGPQTVDGEARRLIAAIVGPVVDAVEDQGEGGAAPGEGIADPRGPALGTRGIEAITDHPRLAKVGAQSFSSMPM